MNAADDKTLIFLHIPKTAGSTLNSILESHYVPRETYATHKSWHHPEGSYEGFLALSQAEKSRLRLLNGHLGFGVHRHLPQEATYLTVLRDPVERILSNYSFERQLPDSPVYEPLQSGEMDLAGYLRYYADVAQMDNLQTRIISGNWQQRGEGPCTDELLATARRNLRDHFLAVGVTERFDEFYLLLKRRLGWRYTLYRAHNRTRRRVARAELSPADLALIRAYNRYDLELYRYACTLFEAEVAGQGATFALELAAFRLANRLYNLYWRFRAISLRHYLKERWPGRAAS